MHFVSFTNPDGYIKLNIKNIEFYVIVATNYVISSNGPSCGIVTFDKNNKVAIIQDLTKMDHCVFAEENNKIENVKQSGSALIRIMMQIAKKEGIKKIQLTDHTGYFCINGQRFDLLIARTLTHGMPYYAKFGFCPLNKEMKKVMNKNHKKIKNTLTKKIKLVKLIKKIQKKNRK